MANHSLKNMGGNSFSKILFKFVIPAIAVLAIGFGVYSYMQIRDLNSQLRTFKENPQILAQQETDALVEKVSKLVVLPTDETPTIATVTDQDALKDQPFFATAEKDDKVLIYAKAQKAILYSVRLNKILEIAPLNLGENSTTPEKKTK
jgi:hypothetical protein